METIQSVYPRNATHIGKIYKYNILENYPITTAFQSFIMTFFTILGDETFILFIILKQKFPKCSLIYYSCLSAILTLNLFNIIIGRTLDLLLYQNFIDISAIIIFLIIAIKHISKIMESKYYLTYREEINQFINVDLYEEDFKMNKTLGIDLGENLIQNLDSPENNKITTEQKYIYKKYYEGHSNFYIFWVFFSNIFLSIFNDCYMYGVIANASICSSKGVLVGSSAGIILSVSLGFYYENKLGSMLKESDMGIIIFFIYFGLASEIFYLNNYLNVL